MRYKTVEKFAKEMDRVLRENQGKGGWKDCDDDYLIKKLLEEVAELINSRIDDKNARLYYTRDFINRLIRSAGNTEDSKHEAIDVANIAMMIWTKPIKKDHKGD